MGQVVVPKSDSSPNAIIGSILGTAVGDAIGLPYEGLSRRRGVRLLGPPQRHRFLCGRGMVSDDTEHTCLVAQALIVSAGRVDKFTASLAWRLRLWLLGIPAGIGLATLRAILRLWLGASPANSGVYSAGNGPAMRAAVLGAAVDDCELLRELVRANTRITHTDPKAEYAAWAIALAARLARTNEPIGGDVLLSRLGLRRDGESPPDGAEELETLLQAAVDSVDAGHSTQTFADSLGLEKGVSGYAYHSVPVAIHAWLSHQTDFRSAVVSVIQCGGDTDSTAAMVGGIIGAAVGREGIPAEWLDRLIEWPRSVTWMQKLGNQLGEVMESGNGQRPVGVAVWGLLPRNLLFLIVVLCHGFRRLSPW